ncbi:hypothetical protein ABVT39_009282 [Epinephelus coioides]
MSSNPPSNTQNCRCCKQRRQSSGPSAVSQSPPRDEPPVTAPNSGAATEGLMGNKTDEGIRLIPGICGENGNLWLPERWLSFGTKNPPQSVQSTAVTTFGLLFIFIFASRKRQVSSSVRLRQEESFDLLLHERDAFRDIHQSLESYCYNTGITASVLQDGDLLELVLNILILIISASHQWHTELKLALCGSGLSLTMVDFTEKLNL